MWQGRGYRLYVLAKFLRKLTSVIVFRILGMTTCHMYAPILGTMHNRMKIESSIKVFVLGLALFSCQKYPNPDDIVTNSLIQGEGSSSFQRTIGGDSGAKPLTSVIQTDDTGYVFCGYNGAISDHGGKELFVLKTDSKGETTWFKTFSYPKNEYGEEIIQTMDKGFLILVPSLTGGGYGTGFLWRHEDLILLKFNSDASLEWDYTNELETDSWFSGVFQSSDSGYVVFYTKEEETDVAIYDRAFYSKIDKDGQKRWEKELPMNRIWAMSKTRDQGSVICGRDENRMLTLIFVDPLGEIVRSGVMGEYSDYLVKSIAEVPCGYAVCGFHSLAPYVEVAFVTVFDSDGNVVWEKDYLDNGIQPNVGFENAFRRSFDHMIATNDGDLALIGMKDDFSEGGTSVYLIKISSETGAVIWEKEFSPGKSNGLHKIHQTMDDGYIAAGYADETGYIIKTDKDGN